MDSSQYTNMQKLYSELELEKYNCALWHCHDANADFQVNVHSPISVLKSIGTKASWKTADKIFLIGQECVAADVIKYDSRIHCWESMSLPDDPRCHFNPFWLHYVQWINRFTNGVAHLTNPHQTKPQYLFDCLLGLSKPNKDFVGDFVENNSLTDRVLYSFFERNSQWLAGHDYDDVKTTNTSQDNINYNNQMTAMKSLFVPHRIYNRSWFSIVAETKSDANFVTEKTAKALIARRLFVVFSGAQHLALLKTLGFETFGNIIDESYDNEPDDVHRWTKATEQIKFLLQQDPTDVYRAALPALEHNQRLMLQTDWNQVLHKSILDTALL